MNTWLKNNWLVVIIVLILIYFAKSFFGISLLSNLAPKSRTTYGNFDAIQMAPSASMDMSYESVKVAPSSSDSRLVIQDTSLSLLVKDVSASIKNIQTTAQSLGGFLVDSNLTRPESAASGNISVRVPEEKREEALDQFKGFAVKVVSESVSGHDVTDQFEDMEERLKILNATRAKFEDILSKATSVQDLLTVQRELVSLQSQIDSVKGRQKYLTETAKLTKISIHLSTDELALPYAPDNTWRPAVVFKQAVRSLVGNIRNVGNAVIWLGVYTPLLLPVALGILYLRKRKKS